MEVLADQLRELRRISAERGIGPFVLPLLLALALLGGLYGKVYLPASTELAGLRAAVEAERGRAARGRTYHLLRGQLRRQYARLGRPEEKEGWLFQKILASSRAQNIVLESISPQSLAGNSEVWTVSIPVSARLDFGALGRWFESLESERPLLSVTKLEASRSRQDPTGPRQIELEIAVVVPKELRALGAEPAPAAGGAAETPLEKVVLSTEELGSFDPGPRDPFAAFGEYEAPPPEPVPGAAETPLQDRIILQGIIFVPGGSSSAIVNDKVRTVGQDVLGARITKITEDAVYFRSGALTFTKEVDR